MEINKRPRLDSEVVGEQLSVANAEASQIVGHNVNGENVNGENGNENTEVRNSERVSELGDDEEDSLVEEYDSEDSGDSEDSEDSDFGPRSTFDLKVLEYVEKIQDIDADLLEELVATRRFNPEKHRALRPCVEVEPSVAEAIRKSILSKPIGDSIAEVWHELESRVRPNVPYDQFLAALGYIFPKDLCDRYSQENLGRAAMYAILNTSKIRIPLPYLSTIHDLKYTIEKANNIVVITGAGISTSLGIPDFRSESGLYKRLEVLGLSDPQEVFDIHLFRQDPTIFYSIAKEVLPRSTKFSPTHAFLKLLQDKGKLLRNYTQNIDNLEVHAGLDPEKVVQCHGSFGTATCQTCHTTVPGETIFDDIRKGIVPICSKCARNNINSKRKPVDSDEEEDTIKGVLKPDITFFGEPLPHRFNQLLLGKDVPEQGDLLKCDLLICIGTSLEVAPVNQVIKYINRDVPQVYISKSVPKFIEFDMSIGGNCDDVVEWIADLMGWEFNHEMNQRKLLQKDLSDYQEKQCALYKYAKGNIIFHKEDRAYEFLQSSI